MAEYRYLFADLLSNEINLELPLYGVTFSRIINDAGNATCSFALDSTGYDNADVLDGTIPGRTALYIDRDGQLIWGGILWSRTYQAQAKVLSWTAQSFESFFNKQVIEVDLNYTAIDQREILVDLVNHMQAKTAADIHIQTPTGWDTPATAFRTVTFKEYSAWTYKKAIEYMVEFDEGFDYTIDVQYGPENEPQKVLRTDQTLGAPVQTTQLVFRYPGNIRNYYYPENASRAAVTTIGIGAGTDELRLKSKVLGVDQIHNGWPNLINIYQNDDVSVQATLDSQTLQANNLKRVPITVPTFQLGDPDDQEVGTWGMGDYAKFEILDPRFPDGIELTARIIGWDVTPSGTGGIEDVKLVIENEEEVEE